MIVGYSNKTHNYPLNIFIEIRILKWRSQFLKLILSPMSFPSSAENNYI